MNSTKYESNKDYWVGSLVLIVLGTIILNFRITQESFIFPMAPIIMTIIHILPLIIILFIKSTIKFDKKVLNILIFIYIYFFYMSFVLYIKYIDSNNFEIANIVHLLSMLCVYISLAIYIDNIKNYVVFYNKLTKAVVNLVFILSIYGLTLSYFGNVSNSGGFTIQSVNVMGIQISQSAVEGIRIASLAGNPNTFGGWLLVAILMNLYLLSINSKKKFLIFQLVILIIALAFTFSLTSILSILIGGLMFLILFFWKSSIVKHLNLILIYLSIFVFSTLVFVINFFDLSGRIQFWKWAFNEYSSSSPIFGMGYKASEDILKVYGSNSTLHNFYLTVLVESGIIGTIIIIILAGYVLINIKMSLKNKINNNLKISVISLLFAIGIHQIFETSLFSMSFLNTVCFILIIIIIKAGENNEY